MLIARIQETASRSPGKTAVQIKEGENYRKLSYAELIGTIAAAAAGLAKQGIAAGDRVAVLSENRPEWICAYLAVTSLGAAVVPLDAQLTEKEVAVLLAAAEIKAVCVSTGTRGKLPQGLSAAVISFDPGDGILFADLVRDHRGAVLPPPRESEDLAAILFTSGTTGDPKGVMLSHGNLASNCASCIELGLVNREDNLLLILPLHHTYPAMACMLLPLSIGATVTMLNSLKGPDILACMQEAGVSIMLGVPQLYAALRRAIFEKIEKSPPAKRIIAKLLLGLSGLLRRRFGVLIGKRLFGAVHERFGPLFRLMASGGARLDPDVYTDLSNLGFMVIEGYGLTETSPVATFNPLGRQKAGSIGIPVPDVEVRIADPDPTGMGEIAIRGLNVMLGYYRKPEATAEVIRDGWFYTGDLGYRDRDGYFFITGRSKEMIVLSTGKKIFPDELEKFYKQLPSIKEICMVETDRGIEAAVVPDFDHLRRLNIANARETIAFEIEDLQREQPAYKRVMGIKTFTDPLPVTRLGKLKRTKVRELYLRGGERAGKAATAADEDLLAEGTARKVLDCLRSFTDKKRIVPDDNIEIDLGLDSLSRVEFVVSLEQTFDLRLPESFGSEVFTVRDVATRIGELLAAGGAGSGQQVRLSWAEILGQEPSDEAKRAAPLQMSALCLVGWRLLRGLLRLIFRTCGSMTVRGTEHLPPTGPYIIAPNHLSNADAPLLAAAMPPSIGSQVFYLGETKFFGGPVMSRIARAIQVIPVNMEARLHGALQLSAYVLRSGKVLCIFPEGTRSRDGRIREFKKGVAIIAKELNVPVVPAAITGTFDMLRAGRYLPRPSRLQVVFGPPLDPSGRSYDEIVSALYDEVVKLQEGREERTAAR